MLVLFSFFGCAKQSNISTFKYTANPIVKVVQKPVKSNVNESILSQNSVKRFIRNDKLNVVFDREKNLIWQDELKSLGNIELI